MSTSFSLVHKYIDMYIKHVYFLWHKVPMLDIWFLGNNNAGNGMRNGEIQRLINSEVPFRKIGEQIADEVT